jgi:hypothetical protein
VKMKNVVLQEKGGPHAGVAPEFEA